MIDWIKENVGGLFDSVKSSAVACTAIIIVTILAGVYYMTHDGVSVDDLESQSAYYSEMMDAQATQAEAEREALSDELDAVRTQSKVNERLLEALHLDVRAILRGSNED